MILSYVLSRRSRRRGERPKWLEAWAPVALDMALAIAVLAQLFEPMMMAIYVSQPSDGASLLVLLAVFVLPFLAVLILSTRSALAARRIGAA